MKQYFTLHYWKGQRLLLLAFLLVHVVVSSVYISWQHTTFDERDYYNYSVKWLHGSVERDNKMFDSKTPLMAVAAIPRIIKQLSDPAYKANDDGLKDLKDGRFFMVIFTIITAIYLFKWIRRLFGAKAWIIPVLFFLFDPMILGFSMIITSDMASGTCLLATCYHLFRFSQEKTFRHFIFFATWLGIGLVCKASLLYFIPLLVLLLMFFLLVTKQRFRFKSLAVYSVVAGVIVLAILNLAYFGKGSFRPLNASSFKSTSFQSLSSLPVIKEIPVPLPYSYIQGLDMLQYHGELGAGYPGSTHHGTYVGDKAKTKGGFWYYYLYMGFYKIPIATLLLIIAGLTLAIFTLIKSPRSVHAWYLFPFVFYFVILSCFNPFQTGFRHFLLIYPFCFLLMAAGINGIKQKFHRADIFAAGLFSWMIISTAIVFPWLISYTNEFIPDKKMIFLRIKDSGIDYGQNLSELNKFMKQHPDYEIPASLPKAGKYIVPAFQLINYSDRPNASWLTRFTPVAHHQYSMFLFDISDKDINSRKQKSRP